MRMRKEPLWPRRWVATAGGTRPRSDSARVTGRSRVRPLSPRVVATVKGIENLLQRVL